jgi:hypothetical protein
MGKYQCKIPIYLFLLPIEIFVFCSIVSLKDEEENFKELKDSDIGDLPNEEHFSPVKGSCVQEEDNIEVFNVLAEAAAPMDREQDFSV